MVLVSRNHTGDCQRRACYSKPSRRPRRSVASDSVSLQLHRIITRRWPTLLAVALAPVLAVGLLAARRVLWPTTSDPQAVDAVVVLAGGNDERLDRALSLVDQGMADVLVISAVNTDLGQRTRIQSLCSGRPDIEVHCVEPVPLTTRGEAATIGAFIRDNGWQSIALVTSDFHLDRATYHFRRCVDATVHPVAAHGGRGLAKVAKEMVGFVYVRTLARGCATSNKSG